MKKVRLSSERLKLIKEVVLTISVAILLGVLFFGIGYWAEYSANKELIEAGKYVVPTHPVAILMHWVCGMIFSMFPTAFLGLSYFLLKFVFKLKSFTRVQCNGWHATLSLWQLGFESPTLGFKTGQHVPRLATLICNQRVVDSISICSSTTMFITSTWCSMG